MPVAERERAAALHRDSHIVDQRVLPASAFPDEGYLSITVLSGMGPPIGDVAG